METNEQERMSRDFFENTKSGDLLYFQTHSKSAEAPVSTDIEKTFDRTFVAVKVRSSTVCALDAFGSNLPSNWKRAISSSCSEKSSRIQKLLLMIMMIKNNCGLIRALNKENVLEANAGGNLREENEKRNLYVWGHFNDDNRATSHVGLNISDNKFVPIKYAITTYSGYYGIRRIRTKTYSRSMSKSSSASTMTTNEDDDNGGNHNAYGESESEIKRSIYHRHVLIGLFALITLDSLDNEGVGKKIEKRGECETAFPFLDDLLDYCASLSFCAHVWCMAVKDECCKNDYEPFEFGTASTTIVTTPIQANFIALVTSTYVLADKVKFATTDESDEKNVVRFYPYGKTNFSKCVHVKNPDWELPEMDFSLIEIGTDERRMTIDLNAASEKCGALIDESDINDYCYGKNVEVNYGI